MKLLLLAVLGAGLAMQTAVLAADHQVQMLNKGSDGSRMVFEPLVVKAAPGDTITFVPTDKSHNSASVKQGLPEGGEAWNGKLNAEITVTVSAEGVYMYKCTPHFGMGMVGAIVVGKPVNLEAVKELKYPGKAKTVAEKIFAEIEAGS